MKLIIPEFREKEQWFSKNAQSYLASGKESRFFLKQAIDGYLLSCKVEGKSLATVQAVGCYDAVEAQKQFSPVE